MANAIPPIPPTIISPPDPPLIHIPPSNSSFNLDESSSPLKRMIEKLKEDLKK